MAALALFLSVVNIVAAAGLVVAWRDLAKVAAKHNECFGAIDRTFTSLSARVTLLVKRIDEL